MATILSRLPGAALLIVDVFVVHELVAQLHLPVLLAAAVVAVLTVVVAYGVSRTATKRQAVGER